MIKHGRKNKKKKNDLKHEREKNTKNSRLERKDFPK